MKYPKPNAHVIAIKMDSGRVRVHRESDTLGGLSTACGRVGRGYLTMWIDLRTLNPERVLWCKRSCWKEER